MERRSVIQLTGTFLAVSVAGCINSSGDGDVDTDSMGEVREDSVEGLEIVRIRGQVNNDRFQVTMTVENTGDQETDLEKYRYGLFLYDESGNDADDPTVGVEYEESVLSPGDKTEIILTNGAQDSPAAVAEYEVALFCPEVRESGVYCD